MNFLTKSYLAYSHGEKNVSPWVILKPLGWLGSVIVRTRRAFYDHGIYASEEPPLPVISVGNLTTGGTNKTPFVEFIAEQLSRWGLKPGIVSRGYGGTTSTPVVVLNGHGDRSVVGDEPLLLSSRLTDIPVAVSSDRMADVAALLNHNIDIVVADDAFQHRRMVRDVDIVLVDATCPFGNGTSLPNGILRELPSSLSRAHAVVISKSDQTSPEALRRLKERISHWVPEERIFYSRLADPAWERWDGRRFIPVGENMAAFSLVVFSAIGNPHSFRNTIVTSGATILREFEFKDHHHYDANDLQKIEDTAQKSGGKAICCTEKDIFNLPQGYVPRVPLYVPRISAVVEESSRFWDVVVQALRPRIVVASNGYGEDAIGAKLARKAARKFPQAEVCAFPLVGSGIPYKKIGVRILPPLSESPTGGIIKYHLHDLYQEIKAGLFRQISRQLSAWDQLRSSCRTVLCVGDAYLLCHTLWGQGKKALMVATAKTKFISGHWKLESFLYRKGCKKVWPRDEETAVELRQSGVAAIFEGNPIMDLSCDNTKGTVPWGEGRRLLVLPGSRERAYKDLSLLLRALSKISERCSIAAVMVPAPSIDIDTLAKTAVGWEFDGLHLRRGRLDIVIYRGEVADAAQGAELLLGLAGTANQVCAGLGVPVLSVIEKGKLVQKKLLGDSELLVEPDADALAEAAVDLLADAERLAYMSSEGRRRLGQSGALDAVLNYAAEQLGWKKRAFVYDELSKRVKFDR